MHIRPFSRALWGISAVAALAALGLSRADHEASAEPAVGKSGGYPFVFRDAGEESGIFPHAAGLRGHGAAWGDVDHNGWPDLFVTTFHDQGSKAAMLLLNDHGKFTLDPQEHLRTSGMGSGALLVDLDNDGDLELYASNCYLKSKDPVRQLPSHLFRNDGNGQFRDISKSSGTCPAEYAGRGLAAFDYDGDGLLDLILCEQYYSAKVKTGPILYRNLGDLKFENVSDKVGLPAGYGGLGVAVGDVNNDGAPDLLFSSGSGENRLYLNDPRRQTFSEAGSVSEVLHWDELGREDTPAGVCMGDVNRDGLLDIVIGNHFKQPWQTPAPVRLYLNRGNKGGTPQFEDVSEAAGVTALRMKAPHVELQDFDNDGWADLFVSIVKFDKQGRPCPVIFKNEGVTGGLPRFSEEAWSVNDFPTTEDLGLRGSGALFEKVLADNKIIYMAAGPTCDYDRDGRLDMFLANWWIEDPSLLLHNETPGGHWIDVTVEGSGDINRMGIGSRINVFKSGKLGDAKSLLGTQEIAIGYGYCSGQEAVAHFGLGEETDVDIEVIFPHNQGRQQLQASADQRVIVTRNGAKLSEKSE